MHGLQRVPVRCRHMSSGPTGSRTAGPPWGFPGVQKALLLPCKSSGEEAETCEPWEGMTSEPPGLQVTGTRAESSRSEQPLSGRATLDPSNTATQGRRDPSAHGRRRLRRHLRLQRPVYTAATQALGVTGADACRAIPPSAEFTSRAPQRAGTRPWTGCRRWW